jgi:hypothetical protein
MCVIDGHLVTLLSVDGGHKTGERNEGEYKKTDEHENEKGTHEGDDELGLARSTCLYTLSTLHPTHSTLYTAR